MTDNVILAQNCKYSTDSNKTGLNNNIIVCGTSGCGKTMSVAEPRLLETKNSSLVITLTKRRLVKKYWELFKKRGYNIWDLNFASPEKSQISYDPIKYIKSHQDITFLAKAIVNADTDPDTVRKDPYWDNAAISLISAIISHEMMTRGKKASMAGAVNTFKTLDFKFTNSGFETSLDQYFKLLSKKNPKAYAVSCWNTFRSVTEKTASCIYSSACNALDKIFTPSLLELFEKDTSVDFEKLANEKTILFITSSAVNPSLNCFINIFYSQVFKTLFEYAEDQEDGRLPLPVHVLCDDFATGSKIVNFAEYISIFREKGISVTLLLQSESQLEGMYGKNDATTIINNCDTYLYFGSMDLTTAKNISQRLDESLDQVLYMPLGDVIVFRRGQHPIKTTRYNITEDENYKALSSDKNNTTRQAS